MGQKVNPILFRITGGTKESFCNWYAKSKEDYANNFFEDLVITKYLERSDIRYHVGDIAIERKSNIPHIIIRTGKSSVILAKKGKSLERIQSDIQKLLNKRISISISDLKKPNLNPRIVALDISRQISKRVSYKKAIKLAIESTMKSGALGIKVKASGRLNGAEIARSETFKQGSMPLHTIREDVDYGFAEASTTYGIIGIKVWIHARSRVMSWK